MTAPSPGGETCESCGTQIAPNLLVCPSCQALVHSNTIKAAVANAERAAIGGDLRRSITEWRAALELLPPGTRQFDAVNEKIKALTTELERTPGAGPAAAADERPWWRRSWALIAAVVIFFLTKGKLLLVGLTKAGTVFSMLAFMGVYWTIWGWQFAVAFVLGIYIHEMGHVAALQHYGIKATMPMFIPGVGAYVRLQQHITDPRVDARVGLAGPVWGLAAGLAAWVAGLATGSQLWLAVAKSTGFINLFNLLPFWQLDGGRGFHSMNRVQRVIAAAVIGASWWYFREGMLILLFLLAVWQVFTTAPEEPDHGSLGTYAALVVVLSWLTSIRVSTPV